MDDIDRNLHDIFSSLHALALLRETSLPPLKALPCLCQKSNQPAEGDASENEGSETDGLYLQHTPQGRLFAVCPACNPQTHCHLCGGTGHMSFAHTHPVETELGIFPQHTETIQPNACSCARLQTLATQLNKAHIPEKYLHAEFQSFQDQHIEPDRLRKKLAKAIDEVEQFCHNVPRHREKKTDKKYFLTLFGPVGSGKTLLATAALKYFIIHNQMSGRFVDFQYLLSQLRAQYDKNKTGEDILEDLRTTDVLCIDEFGKGRHDKEWQLEKLDDLVNSRYNAQKITIITTNYLPFQLKYPAQDAPGQRTFDSYAKETPIHESFWQQPLADRIGMRLYERLVEVSVFVDFTELPSYRKYLGGSFLASLQNKAAPNRP